MPSSDEILAKILASVKNSTNSEQPPPDPQPVDRPAKTKAPPAMLNALAYARHGYRVFPCAPGDKVPRVPSWPRDATIDEAHIRSWWAQNPLLNIGVPCGKDAFTALDVDGEEGKETLRQSELENGDLPETPMAITGKGGRHILFEYEPGISNAVRFAPGLDVRNDGGYIVGVGSKTVGPYVWEIGYELGALPLAKMPGWLVEKIKARTTNNGQPFKLPDLSTMVAGSGVQTTIYKSVRKMKALGMPEEVIRESITNIHNQMPAPLDPKRFRDTVNHALTQPDRPEFLPTTTDGNAAVVIQEPRDLILVETADEAFVSNEEYLKREAIVANLYYEQAISLTVGGKHEGKTTMTRTEALAIAGGDDVYGRKTVQTPVLYAASDDELPTTRMELLRMGWQSRKLPLRLVGINTREDAEAEQILEQIARMAETEGARFIVLDMLFDFIRVQDEIKYAQTRRAVGHIQTLATSIGGHVKATHHSPKWMLDVTNAAKAALGSMGIVAKFSPIVLCRKWADDLFTVESTMCRDPRGLQLKPTLVTLTDQGWSDASQPFQAWMKWRAYADRILGLFQGEPGKMMSVAQVVEALELSRSEVQNAMYQMSGGVGGGVLTRVKVGKKYLYRQSADPDPNLFQN